MTEYAVDEDSGKLKIVKQKINEKTLPPNVDIVKLVYQQLVEKEIDYSQFTDEELENEKQRLLSQLKGNENVSRKSKKQDKV